MTHSIFVRSLAAFVFIVGISNFTKAAHAVECDQISFNLTSRALGYDKTEARYGAQNVVYDKATRICQVEQCDAIVTKSTLLCQNWDEYRDAGDSQSYDKDRNSVNDLWEKTCTHVFGSDEAACVPRLPGIAPTLTRDKPTACELTIQAQCQSY